MLCLSPCSIVFAKISSNIIVLCIGPPISIFWVFNFFRLIRYPLIHFLPLLPTHAYTLFVLTNLSLHDTSKILSSTL